MFPLSSFMSRVAGIAAATAQWFIAEPVGFTYPPTLPSIDVRDIGSSFEVVDFDITAGMPTGKAYYVSTTGSDGADGLTVGTPLASINVAMQKIDVDVVYVEAGLYRRANGFNGVAPTRPVSVIATGGTAISATYDLLSWSADITYPNLSKAARSAVWGIYDGSNLDADGDAEEMLKVTTLLECSTTASSWYTDGVSIWVNPFDARVADVDIWAMITVKNARAVNNNFYIEGFELRGGTPSGDFRGEGAVIQVRGKDCEFKYTRTGDAGGCRTQGAVASVFQNCTAAKNQPDGFNYHSIDVSHIPVALEIDCIGRSNGRSIDTIDNGSTMHDAGTIIRVNGEYKDNWGPNVVDVNDSLSWNLGVFSHDSLAANGQDFYVQGDMWLDKGSVDGSTSNENYYIASGTLNIFATSLPTGTGTLTPYTRTYK